MSQGEVARRVCGARNRSGGTCKNAPTHGGIRCRFHGGTSPRGAAHPAYKHGRYSKYLPANLIKQYRAAADDPELLSAREEAALLAVRLQELVARLDTGEGGGLWAELAGAVREAAAVYREAQAAMSSGDAALAAERLRSLDARLALCSSLVARGEAREAAWAEIREVVQEKTAVAKREWDRLVDMQGLVDAEQAMSLVLAISHSVNRHVPDPAVRAAIAADISTFIHAAPVPGRSGSAAMIAPPGPAVPAALAGPEPAGGRP